MATDDQQVLVTGQASTPAHFKIPGNGQIRPKAVTAHYDGSGAAGDFLAALKVTSDGGELVGVYPISTAIAAGASARVSWFPRVAAAAAGFTSAFLNQSALWQSRHGAQAITSGVVTPITFTSFTSAPAYTPGLFGHPAAVQNPITFADNGNAVMTLNVTFEAGNYDRYVELTIANAADTNATFSPRVRSQITPDGDELTLTAGILGTPGAPATTVTANVFQASGFNKNVTAEWFAHDMRGVIILT